MWSQRLSNIEKDIKKLQRCCCDSSFIGARVFSSAVQTDFSFPTPIEFDSDNFDTDSIHDIVTNNSRLTITTAGKYLIQGQVRTNSGGSGDEVDLYIRLNGTTDIGSVTVVTPGALEDPIIQVSTIYYLEVGDYVELVLKTTDGEVGNDSQQTWFSIVKL